LQVVRQRSGELSEGWLQVARREGGAVSQDLSRSCNRPRDRRGRRPDGKGGRDSRSWTDGHEKGGTLMHAPLNW